MAIKIPFPVMEAMLAAANKAIYSGWTTHQVICACLQAANDEGWVLREEADARNADVDAALAGTTTDIPHVVISLEELLKRRL